MAAIKSSAVPGLVMSPKVQAKMVVSTELKIEPSIGIIARKIDKLGLDIRSFREPLKRSVQRVMGPSFQANFDAGGRPLPWRPLADETVRQKRGNAKPLTRTGKLRKAVGQLNIWTISRETAFVSDLPSRVWYGKVHQAGADYQVLVRNPASLEDYGRMYDMFDIIRSRSDAPEGFMYSNVSIPRRRFIVMQDEDADAIEQIFLDWLGERVRRAMR
jgi:phage gpG-like protein